MNVDETLIQRHVKLFEDGCIYGVVSGGPRLVLSRQQLDELIAYFISHGHFHVGRKKQKASRSSSH
mgnify:CR=1 FL=1